MNRTKIEWVRNPDGTQGFTWNPIVGCSRGCSYCYARRFAKRNGKRCAKCATFEPHLHEERLEGPWKHRKPSGIFVCSMGEINDLALTNHNRWHVWNEIQFATHHRYYLLTKVPTDKPWGCKGDIWMGVTCDCADVEADSKLVYGLSLGGFRKRFISFEPLLGPSCLGVLSWLDWIIIGAQTGPKHEIMAAHKRHPTMTPVPWGKTWTLQPPTEWVQGIIKAANEDNTPVFLKNNLVETRDDLPRRQEVPE